VTPIDWVVVVVYCILVVGIGVFQKKKADKGTDDYFVSGRKLSWWMAGTAMAASAWASDTPLLVTGYIRNHGIWFNWQWWSLAVSSMLAVFFFSRLWRRARVITEVELAELRYSGREAALLRGFKAIYFGVFFVCYTCGAWPVKGLSTVIEVVTSWPPMGAVVFCVLVGMSYSVAAGMWGIVVADLVEMVFMVGGALILAGYAVSAVGGLSALVAKVPPATLRMFPEPDSSVMHSPFFWVVGMLAIQWWAWKNSDGGGMIVQKMAACKDEKNAVYATLWYNVVHNALRIWPWVIVALASIVLIPANDPALMVDGQVNYERAYPLLFARLLPPGLRGLVVASFFAAFMSSVSAMTNWGASYVVNDFYRRFLKKNKDEKHYLRAARLATLFIMAGTIISARLTRSIGGSFTLVLQVTAGVGVVFLLRWFWWRVNAWSEISALLASVPAMLLAKPVAHLLGLAPDDYSSIWNLLYMVVATALVWVPVTLLTRPVDVQRLQDFYRRVRPPAFGWRPIAAITPIEKTDDTRLVLVLWLIGIAFIYSATFGIGQLLLGDRTLGAGLLASAVLLLGVIVWKVRDLPTPRTEGEDDQKP
jgi:solute:Na+ symporter, SSS family